jgi:hypothetical protein
MDTRSLYKIDENILLRWPGTVLHGCAGKIKAISFRQNNLADIYSVKVLLTGDVVNVRADKIMPELTTWGSLEYFTQWKLQPFWTKYVIDILAYKGAP